MMRVLKIGVGSQIGAGLSGYVAELGAAFVLADLGIARTPHPDHASYCASWAPLLRADPRALSHAATQASRAADYLAALQPGSREAAAIQDEEVTHTEYLPEAEPPRTRTRMTTAGTERARRS